MIYGLGDPGSTTSDHRVGAARVTSHDDEVVNRRPDTGSYVVTGAPGVKPRPAARAWRGNSLQSTCNRWG
jgi:hypothetical protein